MTSQAYPWVCLRSRITSSRLVLRAPKPLLRAACDLPRAGLAQHIDDLLFRSSRKGRLMPKIGEHRDRVEQDEGRGELDVAAQIEDYIQFLNHELRTPLAAALAAMEALVATEADTSADASDDPTPQRLLLDIATRNLRRLGQTINWSEEYLRPGLSVVKGEGECWCLDDLMALVKPATGLQSLAWDCTEDEKTIPLASDREGIAILLSQLSRALYYHAPTLRFRLCAAIAPGEDDCHGDTRSPSPRQLLIAFVVADQAEGQPAEKSVGRVARTRLISPREDAEQGDGEFERLVGFSVSPELLLDLAAEIDLCDEWSPGTCPVALRIPVTVSTRTRSE